MITAGNVTGCLFRIGRLSARAASATSGEIAINISLCVCVCVARREGQTRPVIASFLYGEIPF